MKTVIVLGTGNSGAGAVHDYLLSREDFQSPFGGKEFRIVNDPNGIDELYNSLYRNFSINGCASKIDEFEKFIINTYKSRYNKRNNIYNKNLINLADQFIKKIILVEYNGSPQFYFDKISLLKKINFYFKRFILKKNAKEIPMIKMIFPCKEEDFLKYSKEFIFGLYKSHTNFDKTKNVVLEQGGNFLSPLDSTKYYGNDRKVILVSRDPKAIFWSMKRRNSLSYPGHDVKKFVTWYREYSKRFEQINSDNLIKIKFEKFFENFEEEKEKLSINLDIKLKCKDNFNINHTMNNLYKFKNNLSEIEIKYIDDNLIE